MSIYKLAGERLTHLNNQMDRLKPGQIVQGKIVKIFPDNKAQIRLGSKSMIAQLEASLTIGERYHFQVKSTDSLLHLKVLGEQLKKGNEINAKALLQQLGFKGTKSNIAFMKGLINNSIPFEKTDIANALQLLEGAQNKKVTTQLLQQMIFNKLPVTSSVLQASYSIQTSNLSDQIHSMLAAAQKEKNQQSLIRLLESVGTRPLHQKGLLAKEIMNQANNNNQQLFSMLKITGAIDHKIHFSTWKSQWNKFDAGNNVNQHLSSIKLPFGLNPSAVVRGMDQINQQKTVLFASAKEIIQSWGNKISEAILQNTSLAEQDFGRLKQQMMPLFSSLNTKEQQSMMKTLHNSPVDLERLFVILKVLSNSQTYTNSEQLLTQIKSGNEFLQKMPKEQFLLHLKQWVRLSGMNYENQVAHNPTQLETSLKGMLLQLLSTSNGSIQERAGQFLHFMNGMQLNSLHDSNSFLHANLQIPGEKLGLMKDIDLEFESRKTDSGEINAQHCRILFYLHLANLNETVVDMNIQKRAVTLTIYNDEDNPELIFGGLKNMLKTGLEDLDYQLSIVQYQKLNRLDTAVENIKTGRLTPQGVDYRI